MPPQDPNSLPWLKLRRCLEVAPVLACSIPFQLRHQKILVPAICRLGVCGIASFAAAAERRLRRGGKEDRESKDGHAVGARGAHSGHGVGAPRRVGVDVPGSRQRDSPRHAGWGDWPLHCGMNLI